jgi:ABC-2 type transport system ATP-binding protein
MKSTAGSIRLNDVRKSFRSYHGSSIKDLAIRAARREPLVNRRSVLDGITFEVGPGESVGVLGRNGAGKSTLFRLMCGIMVADHGSLHLDGRVSPLIEVTAGMVPDMTGRENLLLNAALLGLTRAETRARFDEIVAFAGLAEFIDTPTRYYSSGMIARLGFSIAVHVDADILLIDEVLAVGDVAFQEQCLLRMRDLNRGGATVVFVSHDLAALSAFCTRFIWLESGRIRADGDAGVVDDFRAALLVPGAT